MLAVVSRHVEKKITSSYVEKTPVINTLFNKVFTF